MKKEFKLLTDPSSGTVEDTAPGTDVTPFLGLGGQPAGDAAHDGTLGVRHDGQDTTVGVADTGDALGAAVRVEGVFHGWLEAGVVNVLDGRETFLNEGLGGDVGRWGEGGTTLTVGDGDGERGAIHAVEEHAGPGGIGVRDTDHADTAFVLLAGVALEAGPVLGARDQLLQTGQELTTVADTQSEGVRALEEVLEFGTGVLVQQDRLGPALTGTKNVAVGETTAGSHTNKAGKGNTSRDDIGHVDIDGGEAGHVESESHLSLAVHTLLTQNSHARLVTERRHRGQAGEHRERLILGVERWVP